LFRGTIADFALAEFGVKFVGFCDELLPAFVRLQFQLVFIFSCAVLPLSSAVFSCAQVQGSDFWFYLRILEPRLNL